MVVRARGEIQERLKEWLDGRQPGPIVRTIPAPHHCNLSNSGGAATAASRHVLCTALRRYTHQSWWCVS
jgi:hypothetical protein